ncbi:hypothetical protein U9M48_030046 [Paspalum notatum var. saurae]|uniref:t-SNARE coiled-coil homology domain-containing protein n=1 Tax=Paspalum notatum var. saurae TaxID=547442 RepID=A0AAQ3TZW2_PASNO
MATRRNRTPLYRNHKYRDAWRHVRAPAGSPSSSGGGGPAGDRMASLLRSTRSSAPTTPPRPDLIKHNSRPLHSLIQNMGFTEVQMSKLKKSEAFTREREREIEQVVESVNELAQTMKDLSVLVIDQAERTQKKGGMVMCATVLVILIFIVGPVYVPKFLVNFTM